MHIWSETTFDETGFWKIIVLEPFLALFEDLSEGLELSDEDHHTHVVKPWCHICWIYFTGLSCEVVLVRCGCKAEASQLVRVNCSC